MTEDWFERLMSKESGVPVASLALIVFLVMMIVGLR